MPEEFQPGSAPEPVPQPDPEGDGARAAATPEHAHAEESAGAFELPGEAAATPAEPGLELCAAIEAIIYSAEEPVTVAQLATAVHGEKDAVRRALRALTAHYEPDERGIGIREVAGGYKFYTKPEHHEAVRRFIKSLQPPLRLSMPALETLAVIAYKQPCTLPEIQDIRGVQASGVIKTLLERGMVTTAGRKEALGRPILYRTTKDFLMRFGLAGVEDLPSLKEFEALARAALGEDGIVPEEEAQAASESVEMSGPEPAVEVPDEQAEKRSSHHGPVIGDGLGPE